jgi:hypothetical protein
LDYHTKMLTLGVMWTLLQQLFSPITSNILNPRAILRLHTTVLKLTILDYSYPDFEKNSSTQSTLELTLSFKCSNKRSQLQGEKPESVT